MHREFTLQLYQKPKPPQVLRSDQVRVEITSPDRITITRTSPKGQFTGWDIAYDLSVTIQEGDDET